MEKASVVIRGRGGSFAAGDAAMLGIAGQTADGIPLNGGDLFPRFGGEVGVLGNVRNDEKRERLADCLQGNLVAFLDQLADVKAHFFHGFSSRAVDGLLVLVDLASREAPGSPLAPAFDQQHLVQGRVENDDPAHVHPDFVFSPLLDGRSDPRYVGRQELGVLEQRFDEVDEAEVGQRRVGFSEEI